MKVIDKHGGYWKDGSSVIICPVCGRKCNVLEKSGELRDIIHCKCRTGKHHTKFCFEIGGDYSYTDNSGNQIIL